MIAIRSAARIAAGALVALWLAVPLARGEAAGARSGIATEAAEEDALVTALAEPWTSDLDRIGDVRHLRFGGAYGMRQGRRTPTLGNTLLKRYFDPLAPGGQARMLEVFSFIRKHAATYGFDPLLIAAQGFQESGLDQSKQSPLGAIGIMQVMPATAGDPNVGIPDIHIAERNVEAGVKYLRFVHDRYFSDPALSALDRTLFSFAAYNAGPGNVAKARKRAEKMGLDPNVWLNSVELAAAQVISREPVAYVRNILRHYVMTYRLAGEKRTAQSE
jgi:soluble lytic murein transglycosylase-like protein